MGVINVRVWFWLLPVVKVVAAGIACLSNPCLHGICIDDVNTTYSCYCVDGYTGVQCQTNWDECWSDPCLNGGTCLDGVAAYNCSCPDGFIGDNCETNYNECESNPCLNNATCVDMDNGYVCACAPGFSGEHCEIDIAVCNSTEEARCYNGGQCIDGPGYKFYCKCTPGWTGRKCEEQIDECQSNPCQNQGVCIDVHADYLCACPFGYTGKSCEVQIEFCADNSCSNNALCVVEDGVRVCYCVPDYHGERCELQYDECQLGPRCMNGGTCIDGVDNFTCSCPPRLSGPTCECLIVDNSTYDCDYVSPTPFPDKSSSMFFTTLSTQIMTTDPIVTKSTSYNDTEPRTISEVDSEITTPVSIIETTAETTEDTTTAEVLTTIPESTETTALVVVTDSAPTEGFSTVAQTTQTIESDNSQIITTTECGETCKKTTESSETATLDTKTTTPNKDITSTQESTSVSSTTTETFTVLPPVTLPPKSSLSTTEIVIVETTSKEPTTTAHELDTTTQSMFTDAPTEQTTIGSDKPIITTPGIETTTLYDNTTLFYTTVQSECDDDVCNNQGTCITTPQGIRCHCTFNYQGRFCENKIRITSAAFGGRSYIAHKLRNTTNFATEFSAKTLNSNGRLMLVNIAKDVYMELYMSSGLLKFKFSCGYQTMLLSELKTYVNKGYPMKIETRLDLYILEHHCNATLRLNDTLAMSGGQVANVTEIDRNSTLYLGNSPDSNNSEVEPFIGCISSLKVNGDSREVFDDAFDALDVTECSSLPCLSGPCLNGGSCKDYGDGYTCSCANGWMGSHCNRSVCEHNPCQSGGSCVRHPGSGFLCLCPFGKHGILCEYNVEITRPSLSPINSGISSFLIYPLSASASNSERFDLRLRIQTADMDQIALLAFVGQNGRHDSKSQHVALTFVKGYIMLTWNVGAGPRRVFTSRALSYRRGGHNIRVWRRGRTAGFSVDGRYNASGNAPAHDGKMATTPYVYIGGHPSDNFNLLPHDLPLHLGWRGCIWEVGGQAIGSGKPIGGRGVGQCGVAQCTAKSCNAPRGICIHSPATYGCICNEGWYGPTCASNKNPCDASVTKCQGKCVITSDNDAQCDCPYGKTGLNCDQELIPTDVLFTGIRSYVRIYPQRLSSVSLALEAEIKPNRERGLIVFAETLHFYTSLSIQGGLLEYRWTDRTSGVTSLVRSGVVLSMSQWHKIKSGRYGSRLYVWVDGSLSTEAMAAHTYPHTVGNASIVLGGAQDLSTLPFDVMSGSTDYFSGCIRHLHVNNILLPLEKQNILEAQNIHDCDGTICGSETCNGGTCVIEAGRARCSCGARCRRHAGCGPRCVTPRGHCRAEQCVCAAGYGGHDCVDEINVSIPQFDGGSLLSLGRKPLFKQSGEQRLGSALSRPTYFSMNFTTPEPMGLVLFLLMDESYLGIGLENGYLKLIYSIHQSNTSTIDYNSLSNEPKTLSRLIPHAGFLSDGEWHILVLRLERSNITLNIDHLLVYYEEVSLYMDTEYDNVDVFIGGLTQNDSTIGRKTFPTNFRGCIDDISTSEGTLVANYSELYSENVKSCQLFPLT